MRILTLNKNSKGDFIAGHILTLLKGKSKSLNKAETPNCNFKKEAKTEF